MSYQLFNFKLKIAIFLLLFSSLCHLSVNSQVISQTAVQDVLGKGKKPRTFGKKIGVSQEMEEASMMSFMDEFEVGPAESSAMMSETLPAGSLIIAMDNPNQDGSDDRVRWSYGLAVHLLHAGIPLKWIINPNKTSRTEADLIANCRLRYPSVGGFTSRAFTTGALAILPSFTGQADAVINAFNGGRGVRVYEVQEPTFAWVHSNLSHKPYVFVEESENPDIHTSIMWWAGMAPGAHYTTGNLLSVGPDQCVTMISVPHNSNITAQMRDAVKAFTRSGGTFFAQCAAIRGFQSQDPRVFTNSGYIDNSGIGGFIYSNITEPSAQFSGNIVDQGGSQVDFGFNSEPPGGTRIVHDAQNRFKAYTGRIDGVTASAGGYVHYLGGHNHDYEINAHRYYLNAVLRQAIRPQQCGLNLCPTSITLNASKASYCEGESILLTASVTGPTPGSYIWQWSADGVNYNTHPPAGSGNTWLLGPGELANTKRFWRVIADCGQQITSHSVETTFIPTPVISIDNAPMCPGGSATLNVIGYDPNAGCFDLTDYRSGVDNRGSVGASGGSMQVTLGLTYSDGGNGLNYYDIQRVGGANDYVDYSFNFPAANYSGVRQFLIDHGPFGMPVYQVWFHDASQGYSGGATTGGPTSGTNVFDLPADPAFKDELNQIIIRIHADWIGGIGATARVHLLALRMCGNTVTWNTGATGPSITVSPGGSTVYSATVNYAGCTAWSAGTVAVLATPTISIDNGAMCQGGATTLNIIGLDPNQGCYEMTNYTLGIDRRGSLGVSSGDLQITQGITHAAAGPGINYYDFTRVGGGNGFIDYNFSFPARNSSGFDRVLIDHFGFGVPNYQVFFWDANQGPSGGAFTGGPTSGVNTFQLHGDPAFKDELVGITIRIYADDIGGIGATQRIHIGRITLCGNSVTWNTGATGPSLTVSPGGSTIYTATVNYGGCTAWSAGIAHVIPYPTISVDNPSICVGQSVTLNANGYDGNQGCVELSNYWFGVDRRGSLGATANVQATLGITHAAIGPGINYYDFTRVDWGEGYGDYYFTFPARNFSGFDRVLIDHFGFGTTRYQVFFQDANQGYSGGAFTSGPTSGVNTFYLPTDPAFKDELVQILIRVHADDIGGVGAAARIHIGRISICGNSIGWNNGANTPSITVAPSESTHYVAQASYGGCVSAVGGTVNVNGLPTAGTIIGPTEVCMPLNNTAGIWSILGNNGNPSWQWSSDNVNWNGWGDGASSPGGGFGGGPVYIRVAVTSGAGCVSYTPTLTLNGINPPPLSVTVDPASICQGQTSVLTQNGFNGWVGAYEISRFQPSLDPRGWVGTTGPEVQVTAPLSHAYDVNYFYVQNVGGGGHYADYNFTLPSTNLASYTALGIDHTGFGAVQYQLWIRDQDHGYTLLGITPGNSGGVEFFNLPTDWWLKDQVNEIKVRIFDSYIGGIGATAAWHARWIVAFSARFSWNDGNPNGAIAVSPSSTTTYTATANYGGCIVSASGTVNVNGLPTAGHIVGPTEVCMPLNNTAGIWSIMENNGNPSWQWSSDNVNWNGWGDGASSPGGAFGGGPVYIRVAVTSGAGCVSYTPTLTLTGINPPPLSVTVDPATICQGQTSTLTQSGFDFWKGAYAISRFNLGYPDPRTTLASTNPADIQVTQGLTYDPNNINYFYVQRVSGNFAYVDYDLNLPSQNLGPYTRLTINHFGYGSVQYQLYIYDASQGYIYIGDSGGPTSGVDYFNLPSDYGSKDQITQIKIRILADYIGGVGAIAAFHIGDIAASASSFSWNDGNPNGTIAVSPASTTTYTATAWYGGCTTSASGTVNVNDLPIAGTIIGPTEVCMPLANTAGVWSILGNNGNASWQWSSDNVNWNGWADGAQSPSGSIGNGPFYIRVAVTSGAGCVSYTPTVTVNGINPPPLSVTVDPASICPGQTSVLTQNGFNGWVGAYEISRFQPSLDPRGWVGTSGPDVQVTVPLSHAYDVNYFYVQNVGGNGHYADYNFTLPATNLSSYTQLGIDHTGFGAVQYQLWIRDQDHGYTLLGITPGYSGGVEYFNLPSEWWLKDQVNEIKVRIFDSYIGGIGATAAWHARWIVAFSGSFSWNDGNPNGSIAVSPASTTTYTATANYGGCTVSASGTVTVNDLPATGYIAGPNEVCMPFGWTGGVWSIYGYSGTPMWQYSLDNVNWTDWGVGGSSPGGAVGNSPFYIRVRVTSGAGCVSYTPTHVVTALTPSTLSVNDASTCPGETTTLTVNGYNPYVACYEISRFASSVDPRTSLSTSSGDIAITLGLSHVPGINYFYVQRVGANGGQYVDYALNVSQNLGAYSRLTMNHNGYGSVRYQVFILDQDQGYTYLGETGGNVGGGLVDFNLPTDYALKDQVVQILIRIYADWIGGIGDNAAFHIGSINACSSSLVWNTGETTTSINVSPQSTTTYTATVSYTNGGCATSANGTVNVTPISPNIVLNASKASFCAGESITLTATVTGASPSSYAWQYSDDGVNFYTYPPAGNGTTWVLSPDNLGFQKKWWRILAQCGTQSVASHSVSTTYVAVPSFVISDVNSCAGQPVTLTANGFDPNGGCFDLADYKHGVDSRGIIGSSGGSMQITLPLIYDAQADGINYYDIQRVGGDNDYVDYSFFFPATNYSGARQFLIDHVGYGMPVYQVWFHDASQGYSGGAMTSGPTSGTNVFDLPADPAFKDELNHIIIRIHADWIGGVGTTARVHLGALRMCGSSILWNTGETTPSIVVSPQSTTTYSATGNYAGCSAGTSGTVIVTPVSVGGTVSPASQTICAGSSIVPVIHTVSGQTGDVVRWEFMTPGGGWNNWSGGGSTTAPGNCCFNTPGTWKIRAIIKNGICAEVASTEADIIVIADPSAPVVGTITQPTCTNPTAVVSLSGLPSGNWTLILSPGGFSVNGNTPTFDFGGLQPSTTYTFAVVNANGCTSPQSANAMINAIPANPTLGGAISVCAGNTANVTPATGGIWTSTNPAIASVTNEGLVTGVTAGTVTLTYTRASDGCSNTVSFTVDACCPILTNNVGTNGNPTTCNGTDGSITICGFNSNQGGYVLSYSKNGAPQTPITITANSIGCYVMSGLTAGSYSQILVTHPVLCIGGSNILGPITLVDPAPATITKGTTMNPSACGVADGFIDISGLTPGILYTLNYDKNGGPQTPIVFNATATSYRIQNLTSGNYTDIRVSYSGCVSNSLFHTLVDPTTPTINLTASSNPTVCSGNDGSFVVSGMAPGSYVLYYLRNSWNQTPISFTISGTSYTVNGLSAGSYTNIRVISNGCVSNSVSVTLSDPGAPVINLGTPNMPSACSFSDGSFTINGLVPGLRYTLRYRRNGINQTPIVFTAVGSSYTLTGLSAAIYSSINVTQGGCISNSLTQVITDPSGPVLAAAVTSNPTICGANDGSITISGLTNGLTYTLNYVYNGVQQAPSTFTASGTTYVLSGLVAGSYTGINMTQGGCISNTVNLMLSNPNGASIDSYAIDAQTCVPGNDGSIVVTGLSQGVTYTLTYKKDGVAQSPISINATTTSYIIGGLTMGIYSEIKVDQAGCLSNAVNEFIMGPTPVMPPTLNPTTLTNDCFSVLADLTLVSATNNPGGFTFTWHTGTPATSSNLVPNPENVGAGTYYASFFSNTTQCYSGTTPIVVTIRPNPSTPAVGAITQPTCTSPTGSVVLSGLPSGNWTITRSPGGVTYTGSGTSYTVTGLPSGATYTFTVTNANNCTSPTSNSVVINSVPGAPVLGGATTVCVNSTANVTPSTGGTWTSSNTSLATVTNAGVVTGINAGTVVLTFTETSSGCSSTRSVTVTNCTSLNPDFGVTYINVPLTGDVSTNDKETPGSTYGNPPANNNNPSPCMPVMSSNGSYTFVCGVIGVYNFYVPVCEPAPNQSSCTPVLLQITVLPLNDPQVGPIANPDYATTLQDVNVIIPVRNNDKCQNGPACTLGTPTVITQPLNGIFIPSTGVYDPNANFVGLDSLKYRVCDNQVPAKCAEAWVYINVEPTGTANLTNAMDDYVQTPLNTPVTGNVKTNDTDPEGNTQTVTPQTVTVPSKGTLVLANTGVFTFTPVNGFYGPVAFPYTTCDNGAPQACATATIHVLVEPLDPVLNPDFGVTYVNIPLTGDVSTNDMETPGSTYGNPPANNNNPSPCMPVVSSNGTYTFVCSVTGVYNFYVPVCEPAPNQSSCEPVLLQITVLPENDPTVGPVANPDYVTTLRDVNVTIPVRANDKCQNGPACTLGTPTLITAPLNGTFTPSTGVYDPNPNFVGLDSLKYQVCDNQVPAKCAEAWVYINVEPTGTANLTNAMDDYAQTPLNTAVTGSVKTNDTDPEGNTQTVTAQNTTIPGKGTLVLASTGAFTFTPVTGFYGPVEYPYTTCDNGTPQACATATVRILVEPLDPVLNPDFGVTYVNIPLTGDVSTNDLETPGSTYGNPPANNSNPSPCMPVVSSNGTYTFVCGVIGVYNFYVPVCEPAQNQASCEPVLLQITVLPENDPTVGPVANPDYVTTLQDVNVTIPVRNNDKCQNGPACTLATPTVITPPLNGTFTPSTGVYDPNPNFVGLDSLKYQVCDNQVSAKCAEAWVYINVEPTGTANLTNAMDDYVQTSSNTPVTGNVKTNDTDPEGNLQTVTAQTTTIPSKGTLVLESTGAFTFTPVNGFYGPVEFPYTTCDNGTPQACATATLHILVQPSLCVTPTLKVFLEGPYVDNGSNSSTMTTKLNNLGYLPGQKPSTFFGIATPAGQPYSDAPWNYSGTEGAGYNHTPGVPATYKANYPTTTTDWVLVSLRESTASTTTVCTKAALLLSNGTIQMVNGFDCCNLDLSKTYYVVVEHRNHLIAMSHVKVAIINNTITYDFTAQQSFKGLLGFGQKLINGKYVMYAGNGQQVISASADTDINVNDKDLWLIQNGRNSSYYKNDLELNGDVNVQDKNLWLINNGRFSDVPR